MAAIYSRSSQAMCDKKIKIEKFYLKIRDTVIQ